MNPKISIIVPVYNVEKYIKSCIDSLVNQTFGDIEIILVDDGSTDDSGKLCDSFTEADSRIKVIHKQNEGLGLARNAGIKEAAGEYIGFVDPDDIADERMYEILYSNAKKVNADISYCGFQKFVNDKDVKKVYEYTSEFKMWNGGEIRRYLLERIGMPPECRNDNLYSASVCCGIFKKNLIIDNMLEFISERELISEDIIFDIDIIQLCKKIIHTELALYYYRYNPVSLTTSYDKNRFDKNIVLYRAMREKLEMIFSEEEYYNSLARYFITFARISVIQEGRYISVNGKDSALKMVKYICNNNELIKLLDRYEYRKLPFKYALLCFMMKKKCYKLILYIVKKMYSV